MGADYVQRLPRVKLTPYKLECRSGMWTGGKTSKYEWTWQPLKALDDELPPGRPALSAGANALPACSSHPRFGVCVSVAVFMWISSFMESPERLVKWVQYHCPHLTERKQAWPFMYLGQSLKPAEPLLRFPQPSGYTLGSHPSLM